MSCDELSFPNEPNVISLNRYKLARLIEKAADWAHAYMNDELEDQEDLGPLLTCPECDSPFWIVAQFGSVCLNCGTVCEDAFHCLEGED